MSTREHSSAGSTGRADDIFKCYSCGRAFRWRSDISGRTLRCKCGSKVRCPELHDETMTAQESLEDTVADVELGEALDTIDTAETVIPGSPDGDVQELFAAYRRHRGAFGLSLGGEVMLYGILSLVGLACAILAFILGKYFWWYIAAAVLIGPISWWRFAHRWKRFCAGRSWMDCLADVFGVSDGEEEAAG